MTARNAGPGFSEAGERAARDLACALVEAARAAGADAADAMVSVGAGVSASARDGAIEELTRDSARAAGVRVVVDGRLGLASAADVPTSPAAIAALAADAVALAKVSSPSAHNLIPSPAPIGADLDAQAAALGLWDDACAAAGPDWVIAQARTLDAVLRGRAGIGGTKDAVASVRRGLSVIAGVDGFVALVRGTSASLSVSGFLDDADGRKQVEGHFDAGRRLGALADAEAVAREAAERVLARRGARKIASGELPVLFTPQAARALLGAVLGAACGDVVARKRSFLADRIGAVVMAPGFPLVDDPHIPGALASRSFDGEGVPALRRTLVDDQGRLQSFLLDRRSASELGTTTTGHAQRGARGLPSPGPSNVVVGGGRGTIDDIIRDTPRGLLVTRMMGRAIDTVTGDMSRAAAGFLIDGGALAFPVDEVTIAGNALDVLRALDRVGADADVRGAIRSPSLRIAKMAIAGL